MQKPNQLQQQQNQKQAQRTQSKYSGTIAGIGSGGIQMDVAGTKYNVAADKSACKIEVSGTVDPSSLKPGMYVHFSGDFDKKGKATAPISDLEIVSPPTTASADKPHSGSPHVAAKKATTTAQGGPATVLGPLKSISNNTVTVDNGGATVQADLSPSASIKVETNDPRMAHELAHPGDQVDVTGYLIQPGTVLAEDIHITLSGSGSDKKPSAKPSDKAISTTSSN